MCSSKGTTQDRHLFNDTLANNMRLLSVSAHWDLSLSLVDMASRAHPRTQRPIQTDTLANSPEKVRNGGLDTHRLIDDGCQVRELDQVVQVGY